MTALALTPAGLSLIEQGSLDELATGATEFDPRAFTILSSREEAEYLVMLDHMEGQRDAEWTAFFVEAMVDFLVWRNRPSGVLAERELDWLILVVADAPSPSVPALLFALVRELNEVPERLMTLALKHAKGRLSAGL
jgi:hypothetical protein